MQIAIFHLGFIYSGGGEKLVLQEAKGLRKLGHSVDIYACVLDKGKSFPDLIKKEKIQTFLPQFKFLKGHEGFVVTMSALLAPFYVHKFKKYDVVLACNQPSPFIAFVTKKLYKIPYVSYLAQPTRILHPRAIDKLTGLSFTKDHSQSLTAQVLVRFKKFLDLLDRSSIRNSSSVLVNGGYMAERIKNTYKVPTSSVPAGVEKVGSDRLKKEPYLLITNRHFPQKRFEYGLLAFSAVLSKFPKYRLKITGRETEYTQELKILVKRLNLERHVDFLGLIPEVKLEKLYRRADIYLYTAPEEDYGMGIVEAMAAGTPVVAWNFAGPSGIIENKFSGLLANKGEVSDFIKCAISLLENRALRQRIANQALKVVKGKFLIKNHINTIQSKLTSAINTLK